VGLRRALGFLPSSRVQTSASTVFTHALCCFCCKKVVPQPAGKVGRTSGGICSACTPAHVLHFALPWACALLTRRGSRMGVHALWHALREEGLLVVVRGSDGEAGPHSVAAQVCRATYAQLALGVPASKT